MPDVGDTVSAEFVGTWTDSGTIRLQSGTEVSVTGATLKVLTRANTLYPGQVWKRNADEVLFMVAQEATGRMVNPANRNGPDAPIPEAAFVRSGYTLLYDPRNQVS